MSAGSIIVDLLMRTGSFETDTQRASKTLQKEFDKMKESVRDLAAAFGIGLSVGAFVEFIKGTIEANAHLEDLAKKTGIAADTIGGIGFAAKQAGSDLDSAAAGAGKLNKSLAEAAAGNEQAAEAFKVLGINVKDATGNTKLADVALAEIADKFAGYADGPEKAALALRIFGKAGADMIPLLDNGGASLLAQIEYFKRYSGVTNETATASNEFGSTLVKIKLLSGAFGQTLTADLLPLLQTLADRFLAAKEQGDGFKAGADGIVTVLKGLVIAGAYVIDTFQGVGREIGAIAAQVKLLDDAAKNGRTFLDPFGTRAAAKAFNSDGYTAISDAVKADGERAKKDLATFVGKVLDPNFAAPETKGVDGKPKPPAPRLPSATAASDAASVLKKQLEGQLKLIQDAEKAQADAYKIGQTFLDGVFEDGLISQQTYFTTQKNLRDANLQNVTDALDKEIAAQKAFIANPAAKPADRVAAEEKIKLAVQQRQEAVTQATGVELLANQSNARSVLQLSDAYKDLNAQLLSASGDDFAAAQIRNARQVRDAQKLVNQAKDNPVLGATVDPDLAVKLGKALDAQNAFNKAQTDSSRLADQLSIVEQRIALAQQTGAIGELDALAKTGHARQAAIGQMESMVAAEEAIAKASGNPALILNAEKARLELDKLKATVDPLADKFRNLFTDAGSNAFADLLNGKTGLKGALTEFFTQIGTEINNTLAKELSNMVFGKDGILGDLGGVFSKAFGGGKDAGLGAFQTLGVDPATSALQQLALAANGAASSMGGGASSAATTASGSSGGWFGSLLSGIGSLFTGSGMSIDTSGYSATGDVGGTQFSQTGEAIRGRRAAGGPVMPNSSYLVGERGPEILRMGNQGGTVMPNGWKGDRDVRPLTINSHTHVYINGIVGKDTPAQIASKNARAVQAAVGRGTV